MTTSDRESTLTIRARTEGQDTVTALAREMDVLAKEGGDLGPKFASLSEELRKLSAQNTRIASLDTAIASAKSAYKELGAARHGVEMLNTQLGAASAAGATAQNLKVLESALKAANKELSQSERSWQQCVPHASGDEPQHRI